MDLFDKHDGLFARDTALDSVIHANQDWKAKAIEHVKTMTGREVTGEDIRIDCATAGITPSSPNAWGAIVNLLVRSGVLVKTGRYRQMKDPKSHARETKTYIVR